MTLLAAAGGDVALVFVEIGAVAVALSVLARVAGRLGITAIPLYILAGLAVGEGGIAPLDLSADFISLTAEIGVLMEASLTAFVVAYWRSDTKQGRPGGRAGQGLTPVQPGATGRHFFNRTKVGLIRHLHRGLPPKR